MEISGLVPNLIKLWNLPRVKILRERWNRFVTVEQLIFRIRGCRGRRNPETDATRTRGSLHRGRKWRQSFDLVPEEVSGEAEVAAVAGENGDDVVRYDVTIRVQKVGRVIDNLKNKNKYIFFNF